MRSWSLLLILLVVGLAVGWAIGLFNRLVKRRNYVEDAWSGIDVHLKRRHDLIPNLVETVKKYANHESATLQRIVELRNQRTAEASPEAQGQHEEQLSRAIDGLMLRVEDYPELKADRNFKALQDQLYQIEEDIQFARRYYNGAVREYNTLVQSFPSNLIAQRYQFLEAEFFEIEEPSERKNPNVNL